MNVGTPRTAARLIVEALERNGTERIFCVPGESYLALLDALYDSTIPLTVCRQEGGAAMMAEAWGKLSGKPGIVMATRGPGATNASAGLHVGRQDSTPMILFVGQVGRSARGREAFQEIEFTKAMGEVAKWVFTIDRAERVPEIVSRAFYEATSGRPGPVVIALPEDMLRETTLAQNPGPWAQVETHPGLNQMAQLQKMLWSAKRPIAILGGSRWSAAATAAVERFAERFDLPVVCSFRRQALFDHEHQSYAGDVGVAVNPKLTARVREADLLLLIGGRMSELPSQSYSLIDSPEPQQALVHVHPGAEELGRVYRPRLAINASPTAFAAALEGIEPPATIPWGAETRLARADYVEWSTPVAHPGGVQVAEIVGWLSRRLPPDAIVTAGAGNYTGWVHRFYRHRGYGTQLAPVSGSMGYGMPAAITAKLRHPERLVVAFAGDGCFQMTSQEFATAVQYGVAFVLIVIDNASYGTIRMHQERDFPDRVIGTELVGPDFSALARSFGGYGEKVETTEGFAPAFERALASSKPALLHIVLDREASTASRTLSEIRGTGKR